MDFETYQCLRFSRQGRVLTVALNRPEQRNAVNAQLHTELSRVWAELQRDADSDVIVLTGEGAAFCAGGDLAWMQSHVDDPAAFDRMAREGKDNTPPTRRQFAAYASRSR
jgi:enoyl-CoA hydratase